MPATKPIGFDNFRTIQLISKDGSGSWMWIKASFAVEESATHKLFRGPYISATTAAANTLVTTVEAHGFHVGQSIRIHKMPSALAGLNGLWVVVTIPSTTTFTVIFDSTTLGNTTAVKAMVGVDIDARLLVADYALIPGRLFIEDYPDAWEMPLEG